MARATIFGYKAEQQPISYHDLHATMLHLLDIDHKKLTYRFTRLTNAFSKKAENHAHAVAIHFI